MFWFRNKENILLLRFLGYFVIHALSYTGLDKKEFSVKLKILSYPSILKYVLGAQKNRLIETVLLSTHNTYVLVEK